MEKEEKKEEGEGKPKLTDEQKAAIAKKITEECKGKEGDEASKCSTEVTEAFMKERLRVVALFSESRCVKFPAEQNNCYKR